MDMTTIIFIALAVLASAARILLKLTATDPVSGFYTGASALVWIHNALFVLGGAAMVVLVCRRARRPDIRRDPVRAQGVLCTALGAVLGMASALGAMQGVLYFTQGSGTVRFMDCIAPVSGFVAAIAFVYMGITLLRAGRRPFSLWLAALPAMYLVVEAVTRFLQYPTIINIADQTLEVVALCLGALFFLAHARALSGHEMASTKTLCAVWGVLFAFVTIPLCAGQAVFLIKYPYSPLNMSAGRLVSLALTALYAAVWSASLPSNNPRAPLEQ